MKRYQKIARYLLVVPALASCAMAFTGQSDVIITLREDFRDPQAVERVVEEYFLTEKFPEPVHGVMPVRLRAGMSLRTTMDLLAGDSRIEHVELDYVVRVVGMPNDELFPRQWALYNPGKKRSDIKALEAWGIHARMATIIIAILDTGIDWRHPELERNMWTNPREAPGNSRDDDGNGFADDVHGWDFAYDTSEPMDRYCHGTLMAGLIGAQRNNGIGIAGLMDRVLLMAVKGLNDAGVGYTSDLIAGIYYAVDNGARIINASWGGGGYQHAMEDALEYARQHDVIFVAASGNDGRDIDRQPFYPASYQASNVVSVGASTDVDSVASFSNYGARSVDLFAPGQEVVSTALNGGYLFASGTSMSAPMVAGCLGMLRSGTPGLSLERCIGMLPGAVEMLPRMAGQCMTGGRLDIYRTLASCPDMRHMVYMAIRILDGQQ